MLRLDYLSCLLTIASTILIGRRKWQGWIVAGLNSVIISVIGMRTAQVGFIPANLFCLAIYGYNIIQWRNSSLRDDRLPKGPRSASESLDADTGSGSVFQPIHYRRRSSPPAVNSDRLAAQASSAHVPRRVGRRAGSASAGDERFSRISDRIRQRSLPRGR
jgi:hypothetical protein